MKICFKTMMIVMFGLWLTGCATVTRGTHDDMIINTEPPGARVTTDLPLPEKSRKTSTKLAKLSGLETYGCPATPCEFEAPRKAEFVMTISKEGYEDVEIGVTRGMNKQAMRANLSGAAVSGFVFGSAAVTSTSSLVFGGVSSSTMAGAMVGTAAGVGAVSLGVDAGTGAIFVLRPNPINIALPPTGTSFEPHPGVEEVLTRRAESESKEAARQARIVARRKKYEDQFKPKAQEAETP